ncbi:hypothetical protein GV054_16310 [Marinomonas mediterranea]|uniref:hypothetical protein n=1 Tax=Marinomonas mediterranea TaxID=119864 RepID=UPI00234A31E3|nr:hypothetical protein [Marinomonas mediterranea]WCN14446.1 hypothetical protein GV054_16310 [Marinomonas mediterranea]
MTFSSDSSIAATLQRIQDVEYALMNYSMNPVYCLREVQTILASLMELESISGTPVSVLCRFVHRYVQGEISKGSRYGANVVGNLFGQMDGIRSIIAANSFEQSKSTLQRLTGLPVWSDNLLTANDVSSRLYYATPKINFDEIVDFLPALESLGSLILDAGDDVHISLETKQPINWLLSRFPAFDWSVAQNTSLTYPEQEYRKEGLNAFLNASPNITLARQGRLSHHEIKSMESLLQSSVRKHYTKAADCVGLETCLSPNYFVPRFLMDKRNLVSQEICDFMTVAGHACMFTSSGGNWLPRLLGRQSCVVEVVVVDIAGRQFCFPSTSLFIGFDRDRFEAEEACVIDYSINEGWGVTEWDGVQFKNNGQRLLKLKLFDKEAWLACDHFQIDFALSYNSQISTNDRLNVWSTDHHGVLIEPNLVSLLFEYDEMVLSKCLLLQRNVKSEHQNKVLLEGDERLVPRTFEMVKGQYIVSPSDAVVEVISAHDLLFLEDEVRYFDQLIPLVSAEGAIYNQRDLVVVFQALDGFVFGVRVLSEVHTKEENHVATFTGELLYDNGYRMKFCTLNDFAARFDWEAISNMAQRLTHMLSEGCVKNGD